MQTPVWALTLSFWLHMLVTVTWVGGLATLSLLVFPLARRSLDHQAYAKFVRAVNKRLDPLGWFGLAAFTVTGLIQMGANPNYDGFLTVTNLWARAILIKHLAFFGIIGVSAAQTWKIAPGLERAALLRSRGKQDSSEETLLQRERLLMRWNLALGLLVLLLTAVARTA